MSLNTFNPHTRQEDERGITRNQEDFSNGMFLDIPASTVPENAVVLLDNFINYGNRLAVRSGTQVYSNTTLPSLTGRTGYSLTKSGTTVTKTVGTDFSDSDIGNYIVYDDGTHELIQAYISTTQVTVNSSTTHAASTSAWVRGPVHATFYHKSEKEILIHIDTRIFISTSSVAGDGTITHMTGWNEIPVVSYDTPANSESTFSEFNDKAILSTETGIFVVRFTDSVPMAYCINTRVPTVKITSSGETETYKRRYLYTMSRFNCRDNYRINRQTPGVELELESGSTQVDDDGVDYGIIGASSVFDGNTISGLTIPTDFVSDTKQYHWTHYSVYTTMDVGENGIDPLKGQANNSNLFVWNEDVPVASAIDINVDGSGYVKIVTGYCLDVQTGTKMYLADGTSHFYIKLTETTGEFATWSWGTPYTGPACFGNGAIMSASQTGNTVTVTTWANGKTGFDSTDVGKILFWANGKTSTIKSYTGANVVDVHESGSISSQAVTMNPTTMSARDTSVDEVLRSRVKSYSLKQRFWENLPNGNIGVITPGFLFNGSRYETRLNYCQIPDGFGYIIGYHNPQFQTTTFDDAIIYAAQFTDKLCIFCTHSTYSIPINVFNSSSIPEVGEVVAIIAGQNLIDSKIGMLDHGSFAMVGKNQAMMITNEPTHRAFDGTQYSDNLSESRINSELRGYQHAFAAIYDPQYGYRFWARSSS
jgi:hypothetical protein